MNGWYEEDAAAENGKEPRTLEVLFANQPELLARMAALIGRRAIALQSLEMRAPEGENGDGEGYARLTLRAVLTEEECRQLKERLRKMIGVIQVKP